MKAKTLNACLLHWSNRVQNGDIAFRFKAVEESHVRVPKSKKKRPAPDSEDEGEQGNLGDLTGSVDGSHSHDDDEETGKGKEKHVPPSWYACIISEMSHLTNHSFGSPANVPREVQDQFTYLFSLSEEKEYVELVKQAADVPVRAI
jgi:hypothetical protein